MRGVRLDDGESGRDSVRPGSVTINPKVSPYRKPPMPNVGQPQELSPMTRRTHGVLAGAMAAALALSACSSGPEASDYKEGDQYTLTVWTNYTGEAGLAWFDSVAKEFEASH